jgi:hypothetical protein
MVFVKHLFIAIAILATGSVLSAVPIAVLPRAMASVRELYFLFGAVGAET